MNAKTKTNYTGMNEVVLQTLNVNEEVATFMQWKELGRSVKKGAKGIELHKVGEYTKEAKGKTVESKYLKRFWVFPLSATEEITTK